MPINVDDHGVDNDGALTIEYLMNVYGKYA